MNIKSNAPLGYAKIKAQKLTDLTDLIRIENDLLSGQLIFLQMADFFNKFDQDIVTLKETLDKMRDLTLKNGGSMARIGDEFLVLSPNASYMFN
jgi:hypothetical protein